MGDNDGYFHLFVNPSGDGEDPDHVWNGLIIAIILAIIGARIYHVFSEPEGGMVGWSYYREHPIEMLYVWQGGLGIYGAIIGGVLHVRLSGAEAAVNPSAMIIGGEVRPDNGFWTALRDHSLAFYRSGAVACRQLPAASPLLPEDGLIE